MTIARPTIFWDNRFNDATPTASTTATGYSVLNIRDWRSYTWWQPTALPATITVDCGSAAATDGLAVWGHNLFTGSCTIETRGSTDNFSSSDVLVDTYTPTDNYPFIRTWNSVSYRYWRTRITGSSVPTIAIIAPGVRLIFPVELELGFDPLGRTTEGSSAKSMKGAPLGTIEIYDLWEESIKFRQLEQAWLRSTFKGIWNSNLKKLPFVFAWDTSDHPTELILARVPDRKFQSKHQIGTYTDLEFKIEGLLAQ